MTNKEKYGNEIIELAVNTGKLVLKNGEPAICEETECEECYFYESDSCKGSTYNFREWLNSEYVEPPVDWTKVPVDTPILVRNSEKTTGNIALGILFGLGAFLGFNMAGSYSDLNIWAGWCLINMGLAIVSFVKLRKRGY